VNAADDRIGHNEAVFRDINERIEAGRWPGEPGEPIAFRCECASLGCNLLIELTLAAYEHVRADPRHFVLAAGHEIAGVEFVVERGADYVVVEKLGEAGRAAEETDPRED
jgi:hypothetical protein